MKFETQRINDCIDFIEAKGLHRTHNGAGEPEGKVRVVATGGGAYKYAERFQVRNGSASGWRRCVHDLSHPVPSMEQLSLVRIGQTLYEACQDTLSPWQGHRLGTLLWNTLEK